MTARAERRAARRRRRAAGEVGGFLKWTMVALCLLLLGAWIFTTVRASPSPAPPPDTPPAPPPVTFAGSARLGAEPPPAVTPVDPPPAPPADPPRAPAPPPAPGEQAGAVARPARRLLDELDMLARRDTSPAAAVAAVVELEEYLVYEPAAIPQPVWDQATAAAFVGAGLRARQHVYYRAETERLRLGERPVRRLFASPVCLEARPVDPPAEGAPGYGLTATHVVRATTVWWQLFLDGDRVPAATVQEYRVGRDPAGRWRIYSTGARFELQLAGVRDELARCSPPAAAAWAALRAAVTAPASTAGEAAAALVQLLEFAAPAAPVAAADWEATVAAAALPSAAGDVLAEARRDRGDMLDFGVERLIRAPVCYTEHTAGGDVRVVRVLVEQWLVTAGAADSYGPYIVDLPLVRDPESGRWLQHAVRLAGEAETPEERLGAVRDMLGRCTAL